MNKMIACVSVSAAESRSDDDGRCSSGKKKKNVIEQFKTKVESMSTDRCSTS